jgi:hypothetical protein
MTVFPSILKTRSAAGLAEAVSPSWQPAAPSRQRPSRRPRWYCPRPRPRCSAGKTTTPPATSTSGSRPDGYPQQHKAARVEHHRGSLCVCTRLTMELTHVSFWLSTFPNRLLGPSSQSGTAYSLGL